ncbi:MAG: aminotransferase class V-fold PLP-dependent enzyme [Pirellulales bacterium]|nr:aminotransferase class V-fold PLP-dependent enzyme [Pirellulales bacterium]
MSSTESQAESTQPWQTLRAQMPVAKRWAYFDHAAVAPLPAPAATYLADWSADAAANGAANWNQWRERAERARQLAAQLLGASAAEIALVPNTTTGLSLVAEGLDWQPGDNVVVPVSDFPSNQYPWMTLASRGVEVRRIECPLERLEPQLVAAACDQRTRAVTVSWVGYATGWRADLDALADVAHGYGAALVVDGIQGLGVNPLDISRTPIDFLAADGHKWLLGPEGAGVLYIRREWLGRLRPWGIGWNSMRHSGDFSHIELDLKDSAARFEGGSLNLAGFGALAASLELLVACEPARIAERLIAYSDELCARLAALGAVIASDRRPAHASAIVSFEWPGESPAAVRQRCLAADVVVNCRGGRVRVSPHAYNDEQDMIRLVSVLQGV